MRRYMDHLHEEWLQRGTGRTQRPMNSFHDIDSFCECISHRSRPAADLLRGRTDRFRADGRTPAPSLSARDFTPAACARKGSRRPFVREDLAAPEPHGAWTQA